MRGFGRTASRVVAAALLVAWAAAAHYTTALVDASWWGALLGITPFAFVGTTLAWRSPLRVASFALLACCAFALALLWPVLVRNVGWMYFIQHLATNGLLGVAFGHTLTGGREPLCSRLAAALYGSLSPELARYTRRVTVAWTLFFALMTATSAALFAFAPLDAWSTFANLLTFPLVALMFVAEYAVRLRALAPRDRGGILDAARAYRRSSVSAAAAPSMTNARPAPTDR